MPFACISLSSFAVFSVLSPGDLRQLFSFLLFLELHHWHRSTARESHVQHPGQKRLAAAQHLTLTRPAISLITFFKERKQQQMTKKRCSAWCLTSPDSRLQHQPFRLLTPSTEADLLCLKMKQNKIALKYFPKYSTTSEISPLWGVPGILFSRWPLTRAQGSGRASPARADCASTWRPEGFL